uniref:Ig-like domain-containing protein n=1 Tax=Gouania willdenowi TaxID=441366 RepID=A0A8C5D3K8_GOUWI
FSMYKTGRDLDEQTASLVSFFVSFLADEDCADKPVFSPSGMLVEYGDPASFRCTTCQHDCQYEQTGLTVSSGGYKKDGNMILWKNNNMTDWDLSPTCYYTKDDGSHCCAHLPGTLLVLLKPPLVHKKIDTTLEKDQYFLQCGVHDVAPIENVTVTFYKRKGDLIQTVGQLTSTITDKTPVTKTFELKVETIEEDDENQYWCEATMDLVLQGSDFSITHASGFKESRYIETCNPAALSQVDSYALSFLFAVSRGLVSGN